MKYMGIVLQKLSIISLLIVAGLVTQNSVYGACRSSVFEIDSFSPDSNTHSIAWVECSNGNIFLAEGNYGVLDEYYTTPKNRIYQFDCYTGTLVETCEFSADFNTLFVTWLKCDDGTVYLAEGNGDLDPYVPQQNRIFRLDCDTGIVQETDEFGHNFFTHSLSWLQCADGRIFLAEGNGNPSVSVGAQDNNLYEFDCYTGTLQYVATFSPLSLTRSVEWFKCDGKIFLAEGNVNQLNKIYQFDCYNSLTQTDSFSSATSTNILASVVCNGKVFLAEGNAKLLAGIGQDNILYSFDCSTGKVTQLTKFSPQSLTHQFSWLTCANGAIFLAEANVEQPNQLYALDCSQGVLVNKNNPRLISPGLFTQALAWLECSSGALFLAEANGDPAQNKFEANRILSADCLCAAESCLCRLLKAACAKGNIGLAVQLYRKATSAQRCCCACDLDPLCVAQIMLQVTDLENFLPACSCDERLVAIVTQTLLLTTNNDIISAVVQEVASGGCCTIVPEVLTNLIKNSAPLSVLCTVLNELFAYGCYSQFVCDWFVMMLKDPRLGEQSAASVLAQLLGNPSCQATGQSVLDELCCDCSGVDLSGVITNAFAALTTVYGQTTLPKLSC